MKIDCATGVIHVEANSNGWTYLAARPNNNADESIALSVDEIDRLVCELKIARRFQRGRHEK